LKTVEEQLPGSRSRPGRILRREVEDPEIVVDSEFDPTVKVVRDRIHVLFEKGQIAQNEEPIETTLLQFYYLRLDDPVLDAELVFFDANVETHGPSGRRIVNGKAVYNKGISRFKTVLKRFDKATLDRIRHFLTKFRNDQGVEYYKALARIVVKYRGGHNMQIGWQFLREKKPKPGRKPSTDLDDYDKITVWEDYDEVWNANFSQFVSQPKPKAPSDNMDVDSACEVDVNRRDTPMAGSDL
jgi:hypothetical protein